MSDPAPGARHRPRVRFAFVAATLFFLVSPLLSLLAHPPAPPVLALLLAGWVVFAGVLVVMVRQSPFAEAESPGRLAAASVAMVVLASIAIAVAGSGEGAALYFYAGVTAARVRPERLALGLIALAAVASTAAITVGGGDLASALSIGVTVATISLTLFALSAMGRTNRALEAARDELAVLAVSEERNRIARDLHDTIGHSLSVIALKSELARRVMPTDPGRAAAEIAEVEHVAREALAAVRETVEGYRTPNLALELAAARSALATAGIDGTVEPAPDGLPPEVDAVLGWAVREGVTNVLLHSDAGWARILVRAGGGVGTVVITDDGHASAPREPGSRSGTGLAGLRERAAALGGRVDAGPLPEGGFSLRVSIPVAGEAAS